MLAAKKECLWLIQRNRAPGWGLGGRAAPLDGYGERRHVMRGMGIHTGGGIVAMPREYKVVNVGSHVNAPATVWEKYFPKELMHLAPKREFRRFGDEGEFECLCLEDECYRMFSSQLGRRTADGKPDHTDNFVPFSESFLEGPDGQRDPKARLVEMDADGIDADVIVPGGYPVMLPKNRQTRWGMMQAQNSWMMDFCAYAPDRLIGIGEIPIWDMELAVQEARRLAAGGLRGVLVPMVPGYEGAWSSPGDRPYIDPFYEPLWQALSDLNLVMTVHADAAAASPGLENYAVPAINLIINKTIPSEMIASLIVKKIFERHPNLKLLLVETGVGWMGHLVTWMDLLSKEHPQLYPDLKEPLSLTFHRHVFGSFLWDTIGIRMRDVIGIDNIMWCNDYPHNYGPWPHSKARYDQDLVGLSAEERHKILAGNAVKLFRLQDAGRAQAAA
jgi:predicted TIM-barrel fold metal-dependent hydrolase